MGAFELDARPVAIAGPNQTVYAFIDGLADVTLDGSASYDPDGVIVAYEFYLSRQTKGDCLGCWLTDAVIAKPPTGLQVQS